MYRIFRNRFSYISHKQLQAIKATYGETKTQKTKMIAHQFKHIAFTGFKSMRQDVRLYRQLSRMPTLSATQQQKKQKIKKDIKRLLPVMFIQAMPMTPILFLGYVKYFPEFVPSWFQVDKEYFQREKTYALNRIEARAQLGEGKVDLKNGSLDDLKLLATALTGRSRDGTNILSRVFGRKVMFKSSIMQTFSKALLRRQIKSYIQNDKSNLDKTLEERLQLKLQALQAIRHQEHQHTTNMLLENSQQPSSMATQSSQQPNSTNTNLPN